MSDYDWRGDTRMRPKDYPAVFALVLVLIACLIFWAAFAFGIYEAQAAIWPDDNPKCSYSGIDMHETYGTSSASCEFAP